MKKSFYVYSHTRNDTNEVFYIGCAGQKNHQYSRSKEVVKDKDRNWLWRKVYNECGRNIKISILHDFDNKVDALSKERELIKFYGKIINSTGTLANLSDGGQGRNGLVKPVYQYTQDGEFVKKWDDMYIASSFYNVGFKAISQSVNKHNMCRGFQWRWEKLPFIENHENLIIRTVFQFDLEGNFIKEYKSMSIACRETGIDRASINHCALGSRVSCGGFKWSYTDRIIIPEHRIITQMDMSGNIIKKFNYLTDIMKELNLNSSTAIRNCFCGKQKQAYGYKWREEIIPAKEWGLSLSRLTTN